MRMGCSGIPFTSMGCSSHISRLSEMPWLNDFPLLWQFIYAKQKAATGVLPFAAFSAFPQTFFCGEE
jgi:hypothetical protein